jgi:hypothetical protein
MLMLPLKKLHGGRGAGRDCIVIEFDSRSVPSSPYKIRGASSIGEAQNLQNELWVIISCMASICASRGTMWEIVCPLDYSANRVLVHLSSL